MDNSEIFKYLGQGYFHQDYQEEHGSPRHTVQVFAMENPLETVLTLRNELVERLAAGLTEESARTLWLDDIDSMYDPAHDHLTYVGWVETVEEILDMAFKERSSPYAV